MCLVIGVRIALVQAVCLRSQRLLNIQGQCQCVQFVQFQSLLLFGSGQSGFGEIVCAATLGDVLDKADAMIPCGVGQSTELLLETWTISHVRSKVGRQQQIVERFLNEIVGIVLEMRQVLRETRVVGIALNELICG